MPRNSPQWPRKRLERLARMMAEGCTRKAAAERLGASFDAVAYRVRTEEYRDVVEMLALGDDGDTLDDEYLEGYMAHPRTKCPYARSDLRRLCAWWGGWNDADMELAL